MNPIDSIDSGFYQDTSRLKNLKGREGLEAAASQFEALFLQMVLKSMRDASSAMAGDNSLVSSQQHQFYQEMADGQLASDLGRRGGLGLAGAMVRQLEGAVGENAHSALKNPGSEVASANLNSPAFQQPLNRPRANEE